MSDGLEKVGKKADAFRSVLLVITACIAIFGSMFTGYLYIDGRYALAEEVRELEKRLTLSELRDSLRLAQDELFFLKSQNRKYPDDQDIKDQLKDVEAKVKDLKEQIKERAKEKDS